MNDENVDLHEKSISLLLLFSILLVYVPPSMLCYLFCVVLLPQFSSSFAHLSRDPDIPWASVAFQPAYGSCRFLLQNVSTCVFVLGVTSLSSLSSFITFSMVLSSCLLYYSSLQYDVHFV